MSRSWKQERTTPKGTPPKVRRPRVSDYARQVYTDKGYILESPQDEPEDPKGLTL